MKKIRVNFYGPLRDLVGTTINEIEIPESGFTLKELKELLLQQFPMLTKNIDSIATVINSTIVKENIVITSQDEISLLPPVSGG